MVEKVEKIEKVERVEKVEKVERVESSGRLMSPSTTFYTLLLY